VYAKPAYFNSKIANNQVFLTLRELLRRQGEVAIALHGVWPKN
jgi:hypothetical protein